jgi:hypothetical protein
MKLKKSVLRSLVLSRATMGLVVVLSFYLPTLMLTHANGNDAVELVSIRTV